MELKTHQCNTSYLWVYSRWTPSASQFSFYKQTVSHVKSLRKVWTHVGEWRYTSIQSSLRSLFPWGKSPRNPLNRRLGGPDSGWGLFGDGRNPLPLPGIEYDSFDTQPKAESACRLLYQGSTVWHNSVVIKVELTTCTGPWVSEWVCEIPYLVSI